MMLILAWPVNKILQSNFVRILRLDHIKNLILKNNMTSRFQQVVEWQKAFQKKNGEATPCNMHKKIPQKILSMQIKHNTLISWLFSKRNIILS